MDYNSNTYKIP